MTRSCAVLVALSLLVGPPSPSRAAPPPHAHHVIGVLASRPKAEVAAGWQPLLDALERSLPTCSFSLEPLDYGEFDAALRQDRLDLAITSPAHWVQIRRRTVSAGVLATIVLQGPRGPVPAYGGAIVARGDDARHRELRDLRRAHVAAVAPDSLGGYQLQLHELRRAGLPLPGRDRLTFTGMPQDRVVEAVLEGRADVGFVRTGILEAMEAAGTLAPGRVRVLHRQDLPDFPYAVSTPLYPEWPVVALPHLGEDHARRIAAVLLGIEGPLGRGEQGSIHGFSIPADYTSVDALLRELRLPPYDGVPAFGPGDVLRRYLVPVAALAAGFAVVAALLVWIAAVNRRLDRARREAQEAATSRERALADLRDAVASMRTLKGLLPICMYCHKIRRDHVSWDRLETYLSEHSEAMFSHSICPTCYRAQFPDDPDAARAPVR